MSRLDKLLAKPKVIEINGEPFDIWPLTVKNLDIITNLEKEEKRVQAIDKLLRITLQKAVPDATDEEFDNISLEYLSDIMDAIIEVNGLADDKARAIKEKLAQQRALKGKDINN